MKDEESFWELEDAGEAPPPEKWKSVLSLILVIVLAIVALRVFFALLMPIIAIVLLISNRDLVGKIVRYIMKLYNDELYKGLIATIIAFFAFAPFLVFLFFRTAYFMFVPSEQATRAEETNATNDFSSEIIDIAIKKKVADYLRDDDTNLKY